MILYECMIYMFNFKRMLGVKLLSTNVKVCPRQLETSKDVVAKYTTRWRYLFFNFLIMWSIYRRYYLSSLLRFFLSTIFCHVQESNLKLYLRDIIWVSFELTIYVESIWLYFIFHFLLLLLCEFSNSIFLK